MDTYGTTLAGMLRGQVRPQPDERVLILGSAGVAQLANDIAPQLNAGEIVVCVYTFDELEDTRAALAGMGNVHVINDLADLDEDEPPFDIVACIAAYHLGREAAIEQLESGVARLAQNGTFFLAGDKQQEFDRYVEALSALARDVQPVSTRGQYRVVSVQGRNVRKSGRISGRRN